MMTNAPVPKFASFSRGNLGRSHLDAVGVQRPFAKALGFTEPSLGELCGLALVRGINIQPALTDLDLATVASKHIFHKADDKMRHPTLPPNATAFLAHLAFLMIDEAPRLRKKRVVKLEPCGYREVVRQDLCCRVDETTARELRQRRAHIAR